jgi:hypothetical protein
MDLFISIHDILCTKLIERLKQPDPPPCVRNRMDVEILELLVELIRIDGTITGDQQSRNVLFTTLTKISEGGMDVYFPDEEKV